MGGAERRRRWVEPGGGTAATAVPDYTLGRDYLSKGLPDRAMAEIRRAMARGADEKEGLVLLAKCFAARGEYNVAEKELSALGVLQSDDRVAVEVASVHRAMGRPLEALRRVRLVTHGPAIYERSQLEGVVGESTTIAA